MSVQDFFQIYNIIALIGIVALAVVLSIRNKNKWGYFVLISLSALEGIIFYVTVFFLDLPATDINIWSTILRSSVETGVFVVMLATDRVAWKRG
jgi:hypothetical protein